MEATAVLNPPNQELGAESIEHSSLRISRLEACVKALASVLAVTMLAVFTGGYFLVFQKDSPDQIVQAQSVQIVDENGLVLAELGRLPGSDGRAGLVFHGEDGSDSVSINGPNGEGSVTAKNLFITNPDGDTQAQLGAIDGWGNGTGLLIRDELGIERLICSVDEENTAGIGFLDGFDSTRMGMELTTLGQAVFAIMGNNEMPRVTISNDYDDLTMFSLFTGKMDPRCLIGLTPSDECFMLMIDENQQPLFVVPSPPEQDVNTEEPLTLDDIFGFLELFEFFLY